MPLRLAWSVSRPRSTRTLLPLQAAAVPSRRCAESMDRAIPDELAACQLQYQRLVEGGHRRKVEGVQAFHRREAGLADAPFDEAALAVDQFKLGQAQQVSWVIDALPGTIAGDLLVLARKGRQLQGLQVMRQQHLRRCGAHAALRDSRAA